MKEHADNKRYVKPSTITEGDVVLVKEDEQRRKATRRITQNHAQLLRQKELWSLKRS